MDAVDEDYEQLETKQRLKAAIHYTVGRICEETGQNMGVKYSRQFVAALTEATDTFCQRLATDLELFAKHAKRSTINSEDVKLFVRKSPDLYQHIEQLEGQLTGNKQKKKADKKRKGSNKQRDAAAPQDGHEEEEAIDDEDDASNVV